MCFSWPAPPGLRLRLACAHDPRAHAPRCRPRPSARLGCTAAVFCKRMARARPAALVAAPPAPLPRFQRTCSRNEAPPVAPSLAARRATTRRRAPSLDELALVALVVLVVPAQRPRSRHARAPSTAPARAAQRLAHSPGARKLRAGGAREPGGTRRTRSESPTGRQSRWAAAPAPRGKSRPAESPRAPAPSARSPRAAALDGAHGAACARARAQGRGRRGRGRTMKAPSFLVSIDLWWCSVSGTCERDAACPSSTG
jgi:hypothetical protein